MISKIKKGFTLIEMIVVVTLFSIIIIIAFEAMWNISIFRTRLSSRLDIEQDLYYTMETLSSNIKDFWWDIDYEEYFNRQMMWISTGSWHYDIFSWFGNYWSGWDLGSNYWSWLYLCRSWSGAAATMWTWWCANSIYNNYWGDTTWKPQRFWQYALQFIDFNSNANNDTILWDENWDWKIAWDDDDENIWQWPEAFTGNLVQELYLIRSGKKNERMLLRLNIIQDPNSPWITCSLPAGTWSWCLGNIQILKLDWKDYWLDHNSWSIVGDNWSQFDWIIDTWKCNSDFYCPNANNIPQSEDWWIDLLPDYINVKNIKFYLYPKKDYKLAWAEDDENININPYIKLNITLWYAWNKKKLLKWINPEINLTTTINLTKN